MTVLRELSRYKLDLGGMQEDSGTELAEEYTFFYGEMNENQKSGTGIFEHKTIISAINSVESVRYT
jgi:hypothetical protein